MVLSPEKPSAPAIVSIVLLAGTRCESALKIPHFFIFFSQAKGAVCTLQLELSPQDKRPRENNATREFGGECKHVGGADHRGGCQYIPCNKQCHWGVGGVVIVPHFTTCATAVCVVCKGFAGVWRRANQMDIAFSVKGTLSSLRGTAWS